MIPATHGETGDFMPGVQDEDREGSEELATVQEVLPEIPPDIQSKLKHIEEISKNARGTWLSLIAVLLFSAIAVAGVKDSDYFIYGAGLVLPVINVAVPVKSFFYAGPLIILGLYTYLHLYLLKLWRALAETGAEPVPGLRLDDLVFPWLISDAAISLMPDARGRPFGWLIQAVSFVFLWLAAPMILILFWLRSFPPHDVFLTSWIGFLISLAFAGGQISYGLSRAILRSQSTAGSREPVTSLPWIVRIGLVVLCIGYLFVGWDVTSKFYPVRLNDKIAAFGVDDDVRWHNVMDWQEFDDGGWLPVYSANLYRAELVERPSNWLPREEALEEFKARYSGEKRKAFQAEGYENTGWIRHAEEAFQKQRDSLLTRLRALDFPGASFRKVNLEQAFLPGLDLKGADLRAANLARATLEGADLMGANLQDADLRDANLQDAVLRGAKLQNAELWNANLQDAEMLGAKLQDADLWNANLQDADLRREPARRKDVGREAAKRRPEAREPARRRDVGREPARRRPEGRRCQQCVFPICATGIC